MKKPKAYQHFPINKIAILWAIPPKKGVSTVVSIFPMNHDIYIYTHRNIHIHTLKILLYDVNIMMFIYIYTLW